MPPTEPPKLMLYPEKAVELGEPNILICMADDFSPPVLKMSWFKNGQPLTERVQTMDYYPKKNNAFRRFSYLPFIPTLQDDYACQVSHWGLSEPLTKIWSKHKGSADGAGAGGITGEGGPSLLLDGAAFRVSGPACLSRWEKGVWSKSTMLVGVLQVKCRCV